MRNSNSSSKLAPVLGGIAMVMGATLLGLVLAEGLLRLFGFRGATIVELHEIVQPVDDPVLDFRYPRSTTHRVGEVDFRFNDRGFRDVDHAPVAAPGVTRIVVVGDSIVDGWGVAQQDTFQAATRRKLGEAVELITIAMCGLDTLQEVHLLEQEGLQFDPDIVVLQVALNDASPGMTLAATTAAAEREGTEIRMLGTHVDPRLKRLLLSSALVYAVKQSLDDFLVAGVNGNAEDAISKPWSNERNRAKVAEGFSRLAELRDATGFEVLVMVWPVLVDFDTYAYDEIHGWIAEQAASRGFELMDLREVLAAGADHRELLQNDYDAFHPNAVGYELSAAAFARWYRSRPAAR